MKSESGATKGLLWRIGAAIASPAQALNESDRPENAGRSATDLTLLLVFGFVAVNLESVVRSGYLMIAGGEIAGGLQTVVSKAASDLARPLLALLCGFVIVYLLAGKRREFGRDSDLACVAFVPLVLVLVLAGAWRLHIGAVAGPTSIAFAVVAVGWFAFGLFVAIGVARGREDSAS